MKTNVNMNMATDNVEITAIEENTVATPLKKLTKKECYGILSDIVSACNHKRAGYLMEFLAHEIALLEKKSTSSKDSSAKKENDRISQVILDVLAEQEKPVQVSTLLEDSRLSSWNEETKNGVVVRKMSGQKLSALMKRLKDSGKVVRTEEKKKAYFALAK